MKVTFIERAPGTWRLRIENGRDENGKRRFSYETLQGVEDDAARRRFEILKAHEEGSFADPKKLTLAAYLTRWIEQRQALGKISRMTAENYTQMLKVHVLPTLGSLQLQRVGGSDLQGLYTGLLKRDALGRSSVAHLHRILSKAFKDARRARLIVVNPIEEIEPPRPDTPKPKALDDAALAVLLPALAGDWKEPIALVAFGAGLRRGEVLGLRRKDVDLAGAALDVRGQLVEYRDHSVEWKAPKTAAGARRVSIPAELVGVLRQVMLDGVQARMRLKLGRDGLEDAYVFTSDGVAPIKPTRLTRSFKTLCDRLGLPEFTFHSTRHSHATVLLKKVGKAGAKAVSQRLGHADIVTTLRTYQTVLADDDRELAELAGGLLGVQNVPGKAPRGA